MIRMSSIVTSSMFILLLQHPGMANSLAPGDSLRGYQCYNIDVMKLAITREDAWAGRGFPPVFDQPSAASKQIGNAAGPVYVVGPLQEDNGFIRIVRAEGQFGWIAARAIRPLFAEPGSKGGCTLSWRGNRIEYHLDPGAKAWLFPDGHDIPNDTLR